MSSEDAGRGTDAASCELCGLPAGGADVTDDDGNRFCCRGCLRVHSSLDDAPVGGDEIRERARSPSPSSPSDTDDPSEDHETTFLEIRGMYCASCEAFVESVAESVDGVSSASASYVTERARIDHDSTVRRSDLREAVSGLGYKAFAQDDDFSRRQTEFKETLRVAFGVALFMLVMMQYVTIIYPTYFGGLFYDEGTAAFLGDAMSQPGGVYFFVLLAVLTGLLILVTGRPILQGAYVALRARSPNMDLLVAVAALSAYLYSCLAVVTVDDPHVYYDVTATIIVVVTVGGRYEETLKRKATDRLSELTSVQVDEANLVTDDGPVEVSVEGLGSGDRVLVREGDRVPVDGTVVEGQAAVDESVVTGESMPVRKSEGDDVVGGSTVTDGAVTVRVADGATSSLDRISELVWDLQSSDHGIQGLADRLATVFVPVVLSLAVVVTAVRLGLSSGLTDALLVGLTVLIVSCPCALGLATPLAVASGIRDALAEGIVVFDETVFERVREADIVVFDKTGTLTTGEMEVLAIELPDEALSLAAALESRSAHPVGEAISAAAGAGEAVPDGGTVADSAVTVEGFESHDRGVSGTVDGERVAVGHPDLFEALGWEVPDGVRDACDEARGLGRVPVVVGVDGEARGYVVVGDEPREGWSETVSSLADRGTEVVVLTGDDELSTGAVADHDGVGRVFAGVPPEAKAETVARLSAEGQTVMVGDGTNDAPALARADLGVALGGGTAMAVDAADVAIVDDDIRSVTEVFDVASAAGRRVKQNIGWAFLYNGVAIPLAVAGLLNPLLAAVAMGTSSLLVVANSSRSLLD